MSNWPRTAPCPAATWAARTVRVGPASWNASPLPWEAAMKAVALYEMGPDMMTRVPAHLAAHRERWREFAARGELLMIGPFANAQEDGAMAIFTTREAAEEFVRGDPFVLTGIVRNWYIRAWIEALAPEPLAEAGG